MNFFKYLRHIPFIESIYVQKILDDECDKYYNKIEMIKDSFLRKFFLQTVNYGKLGAYELYSYMKKNLSDGNDCFHETSTMATIFKWTSLYHIARFLRENSDEIDNSAIQTGVPDLFLLCEQDYTSFTGLIEISHDNTAEFEIRFSGFFILKALEKQSNTAVMLAFIDNFFYNSYNEFISTFTNYVSISNNGLTYNR